VGLGENKKPPPFVPPPPPPPPRSNRHIFARLAELFRAAHRPWRRIDLDKQESGTAGPFPPANFTMKFGQVLTGDRSMLGRAGQQPRKDRPCAMTEGGAGDRATQHWNNIGRFPRRFTNPVLLRLSGLESTPTGIFPGGAANWPGRCITRRLVQSFPVE